MVRVLFHLSVNHVKNPKILIKNTGEYNLRSVDIYYGLKNRKKSIFRWIGDIEFLEKTYIDLPKINWLGLKHSQNFEVTLKNPNGIPFPVPLYL